MKSTRRIVSFFIILMLMAALFATSSTAAGFRDWQISGSNTLQPGNRFATAITGLKKLKTI